MRGRTVAGLVLGALLALTAGCTTSTVPGDQPGPSGSASTRTVTVTTTPPPSYHPVRDRAVPVLPPGAPAPRGEVDRLCPYIRTGLNEDGSYGGSNDNVADIEGDRIYRTTVLTRFHPHGCRFYFYAPPYEAVADIQPHTFPSALDAHNALVLTARLGTDPITERAFVPGVDGILYRTAFFSQDGRRDWAFAFAKGRVLVVVHTQRSDTSLNALLLGKAIVSKF